MQEQNETKQNQTVQNKTVNKEQQVNQDINMQKLDQLYKLDIDEIIKLHDATKKQSTKLQNGDMEFNQKLLINTHLCKIINNKMRNVKPLNDHKTTLMMILKKSCFDTIKNNLNNNIDQYNNNNNDVSSLKYIVGGNFKLITKIYQSKSKNSTKHKYVNKRSEILICIIITR